MNFDEKYIGQDWGVLGYFKQSYNIIIGMARGIPRPSILEVPAFFLLLEPRGIDSIALRLLEVLAKTPRGPRKIIKGHIF